jgi:hypothetical protein
LLYLYPSFALYSIVWTIREITSLLPHRVVWGKVANTGGSSSNPISVQIACTNTNSGAPLCSTTTPLVPSVLGPGDTGTFSQAISSDDLQGTKYSFSCTAQVIGQWGLFWVQI